MKTSEKCKAVMAHHEGVRYRPYLCPAHIWTIGIGSVLYHEQIRLPVAHTPQHLAMPPHERPMLRKHFPLRPEHDRQWSKEEVYALFAQDLRRFEEGVPRLCPAAVGDQNHFDALVSFSFNVGLGNLQSSTLRMKYNRGDYEGAADQFLVWNKGGGRVLPGLVTRRKDERALFLGQA